MIFDEIIDRRGTHSAKWDMMEPLYGVSPTEGISMWVADMDFKASPDVIEAISLRVNHGIFGYENSKDTLPTAVSNWYKNRHAWSYSKDKILFTPVLR